VCAGFFYLRVWGIFFSKKKYKYINIANLGQIQNKNKISKYKNK
jgi:hypothetical protein